MANEKKEKAAKTHSNKQEKIHNNKQPTQKGYAHIDTFLDTAISWFGLTQYQVPGFKAYMQGKFYQKTEKDFIPYLEKYLGRNLK